MRYAQRRLVIVVRADPVICGHSGEARNLAEVALTRGFDDVRLLTWPIATLQATGLPLKPLDRLQPYSPGITVERPEPVGDYRVPDGRHLAGLTGRLVELLAEPVPTTCLAMYLVPHANVVIDAVNSARAAGFDPDVHTIAKAVGSDVTNVIQNCLREGRFGAAAFLLTTFLAHDEVVAVSDYTRDEIVARGRGRRPALRHPVRDGVPQAGDRQLPADRHLGLRRPRRLRRWTPHSPGAGWSATATSCSCPG